MDNDGLSLADTEVHYLTSSSTGGEFKLFIGRCGGEPTAHPPIPTLFVIDGNGFFGLAVDMIRSMQLAAHLPAILVVGIGYRTGTLAETIPSRANDLTPSVDVRYIDLCPEQAHLGGAADFLQFVRAELIPWVDDRFGDPSGGRALFGHSLGGLFGTYALVTAPDTFGRYIISSPSLWWHRGIIHTFEESYASTHDDLPARVFFGIGSEETQAGRLREAANLPEADQRLAAAWPIDMVDDLRRFTGRLRQRRYPGLDLTDRVFADEFHITVPQLTMSRGLRTLFDAPW